MSKIIIKCLCHSTGGVGPVLSGNTGMIAGVVRTGAGVYAFTTDEQFPLDANDIVRVVPEGIAPLLQAVERLTVTTFTARFVDAGGAVVDPANMAVIVEAPLEG